MRRKLDGLAVPDLEKALALARELGDKQNEARWLTTLAAAHHHLGDYEQAIACNERASSIMKALVGYPEAPAVVEIEGNIRKSKSLRDSPDRLDVALRRMGLTIVDEPELTKSRTRRNLGLVLLGAALALLSVPALLHWFGSP